MAGWLGSSVVECSHGQRNALGSSPGRATIVHLLHLHYRTFKVHESNQSQAAQCVLLNILLPLHFRRDVRLLQLILTTNVFGPTACLKNMMIMSRDAVNIS